jgi:hypothetical protein
MRAPAASSIVRLAFAFHADQGSLHVERLAVSNAARKMSGQDIAASR